MAVGDAAIRRPLSIARDIRRARLGQDRLSKLLMALIDPNVAPVRALPREERELMIAANNSHLLGFDNLSGLPAWLSDALCRLATGGSFAVRQLYTDDEEVLFQAARPLLVNGIEDVISRADLADRGIFLTLAPIGERQRRSEAEDRKSVVRPSLAECGVNWICEGRHRPPGASSWAAPPVRLGAGERPGRESQVGRSERAPAADSSLFFTCSSGRESP